MKKVLVTGGLGMVGSHVAEELAKRGDHVTVVDNLRTGREINIKDRSDMQIHIADIAEKEYFDGLPSNEFDVVIHTAASYADSTNWTEDARTNILGSINVAKFAEKQNSRVIFFKPRFVTDLFQVSIQFRLITLKSSPFKLCNFKNCW